MGSSGSTSDGSTLWPRESGPHGSALLLPHSEGTSLFPISEYPLPVYIFRALNDGIFKGLPASSDSLELTAWGEIYDTRDNAEALGSQNRHTEN